MYPLVPHENGYQVWMLTDSKGDIVHICEARTLQRFADENDMLAQVRPHASELC